MNGSWVCPNCGNTNFPIALRSDGYMPCPVCGKLLILSDNAFEKIELEVSNKSSIYNFEGLHASDIEEPIKPIETKWYGISDLVATLDRIAAALEKIANK